MSAVSPFVDEVANEPGTSQRPNSELPPAWTQSGRLLPLSLRFASHYRLGDVPFVRSRLQLATAGVRHRHGAGRAVIVCDVDGPFGLIEFPADDPDRARRFWSGLLGIELPERSQAEGRGWQTRAALLYSAFTTVAPGRATRPRCRTSPSPISRPRWSRSRGSGEA